MTLFTLLFAFFTACSSSRGGEGDKCSSNEDCTPGLACDLNTNHDTMAYKCIDVMKWKRCTEVCNDAAFRDDKKDACRDSCEQEAIGKAPTPEIVSLRNDVKSKADKKEKAASKGPSCQKACELAQADPRKAPSFIRKHWSTKGKKEVDRCLEEALSSAKLPAELDCNKKAIAACERACSKE